MSSPYDRYDRASSRPRRGLWSHWMPLIVTVTVATVGIAAWVWSQRRDEDEEVEEHEPHLDYENADYGDNPAYGASDDHRPPPEMRPDGESFGAQPQGDAAAPSWGSRMSGALRRTPSPQQFLGSASKTVAAGVAAAGAAVNSALSSIREEDKNTYAAHEVWSEEADAKKAKGAASPTKDSGKRRKVVAVVVSAENHAGNVDEDGFHEHASILSHIPKNTDFTKIKLFILIYAPGLKEVSGDPTSNLPPPSLSSSFSNIGHNEAQTPNEETKSPWINPSSSNPAFNAVYSQALGLVEKEIMVLPFTTPNGHAHMLRILQPEIIYLQESLGGDNGSVVTQLQTWLRHDIILVVGAESGSGGLADSESEAEKPGKVEKWWQKPDRVGRGRGVVVVDGMRVHDDWARRVQGKE